MRMRGQLEIGHFRKLKPRWERRRPHLWPQATHTALWPRLAKAGETPAFPETWEAALSAPAKMAFVGRPK